MITHKYFDLPQLRYFVLSWLISGKEGKTWQLTILLNIYFIISSCLESLSFFSEIQWSTEIEQPRGRIMHLLPFKFVQQKLCCWSNRATLRHCQCCSLGNPNYLCPLIKPYPCREGWKSDLCQVLQIPQKLRPHPNLS